MKLQAVPGLQATLRVDGVDLVEYADEDTDHASILTESRFVEVVSGTNFVIHVRVNLALETPQTPKGAEAPDCVGLYVKLDGKHVTAKFIELPTIFREPQVWLDGVSVHDKGASYFCKFQFSELATSKLCGFRGRSRH